MALNYFHLAQRQLKNPADREFATYLGSLYPTFRQDFLIPTNEGVGATEHPQPQKECIYLCGNSLGLQPKLTRALIAAELDVWASRGVQGHFRHEKWPWVSIHEACTATTAEIVGARVEEIAIMGSLTANLHLLMAAFYNPTLQRHKIIIESKAFPSDHVLLICPSLTLVCYRIANTLAWLRSQDVFSTDNAITGRVYPLLRANTISHLRACRIHCTPTSTRHPILYWSSIQYCRHNGIRTFQRNRGWMGSSACSGQLGSTATRLEC